MGWGACALILLACNKETKVTAEAAAADPSASASAAPSATAPATTASTPTTPTHIDCAKNFVQVGNYCQKMCSSDSDCTGNGTCTGTQKADDGSNKIVRFCLNAQILDAGKAAPMCNLPQQPLSTGQCAVPCTANTDCTAPPGYVCTGSGTIFGTTNAVKFCQEPACGAGQAFDMTAGACAVICTADTNCKAPFKCTALPTGGKKVCRK
jgi:hypothetical protein